MKFLQSITPREYQQKIFETCVKKNCLVVLPTGIGKCLEFSQPILLGDGSLIKIGKLFEKSAGKIAQNNRDHIIKKPNEKIETISLNNNLKLEKKKIIAIHKIKTKEPLLKITTYGGAEIIVTPEHPFLTLSNKLAWERADKFKLNDLIATPSQLPELEKEIQIDLLKTFSQISNHFNCYVKIDRYLAKKYKIKTEIKLKEIIKKGIKRKELKNNIKYFYITGSRANKTKIKPLWKTSKELFYWIGLIIAEGSISGGIRFYNNNKKLLDEFDRLSKNLFGIQSRKIKGGLNINSTALFYFVKNLFNLETNQHSRDKKISNIIMTSKNKYTASFISALYDGEGSVRKDGLIEFMTASKKLANNLCYLLLRFDIKGRINEKICSATNSPLPKKRTYYRIYIEGKKDLENFYRHIGFKHKEKQIKLKQYLARNINYNPNMNLIPISGKFIREIRNSLKLSSTKWKDFKIPGIDTYERGERKFSHETLRKTIEGFEKRSSVDKGIISKINFLKKLLNSHIYWDKIKKIEKVKEEWVYDISLDKNFNFIAGRNGGFIAHNTLIALMLVIDRMQKFPGEKVVFLAPTKPLAEQHLNYFKKYLPELFASMELFTGAVNSSKRKKIWQTADIVFSTPQCVANDVRKNLYNLNEVCLLVEDEAHRCVKNYDYNFVAQKYKSQSEHSRILGLTASPGSEALRIKEICKNLSIQEVELRTRESTDVKKYLQELEFKKVDVVFPPEFEEIKQILLELFNKYVEELRKRKILFGSASKTALIKLQKKIMGFLARGNRNFNYMLGASACAQAIKLQHALELLETQTLEGFNKYLKTLFHQASKKQSRGVVKLVAKPEFNFVFMKSNELLAKKVEHPKIEKILEIVKKEKKENQKIKIIVFTQFRETASIMSKKINQLKNVMAKVFVGQAKKNGLGMNQKEQRKIINEFSRGEINILVATCIAEEGLDIPEVNAVIFYEPIPSAIRTIQRAGRTARLMKGKLFMLVTKKTRDESFFYISRAKERKMKEAISDIRKKLTRGEKLDFQREL